MRRLAKMLRRRQGSGPFDERYHHDVIERAMAQQTVTRLL